jgi:hypothetical protein
MDFDEETDLCVKDDIIRNHLSLPVQGISGIR